MISSFTMNENPGKCGMLTNISSEFGIIVAVCAETYVLWDRNRILLMVILGTYLLFLTATIGIAINASICAAYATSPIPGITGCYQSPTTTDRIFILFLLFSVFELGNTDWRRTPYCLYVVLVNHNIFYYASAFLLVTMNMFTLLFLQTILNGYAPLHPTVYSY
ncbi:uncharacterized protein F5147DRAFT_724646 [Suillus discolor]|uniref:Uncharacterized protein n=1 Tax=Suillus discolor TaxID=1912936 RepID=A0A9P7EUU0_9AGAM|nr:uncharacterized protein F5147DRAFT_724646 [Suillus discolor]KAG2090490.1 hypothetical protein F5147DRAFT_724646 [Suillus discolor]